MTRKEFLRQMHRAEDIGAFERNDIGDIGRTTKACTRVVEGECEWFNFGDLNFDRDVLPAYEDGLKFLTEGFYIPPYDRFVFQAKIDEGAEGVIDVLLVTCKADNWYTQAFYVPDGQSLIHPGVAFLMCPGEKQENTIQHVTGLPTDTHEHHAAMARGARTQLLAMWMILNTKGVEKTRVEPDAKLQAARVKAGKPPLPAITYINTVKYQAAQRAAATHSERASPRPHLRRGHLRRWGERVLMIPPCIVAAAEGSPLRRKQYKVLGAQ